MVLRYPALQCTCGRVVLLQPSMVVETNTDGATGCIWQTKCACTRAYTLELAHEPQQLAT